MAYNIVKLFVWSGDQAPSIVNDVQGVEIKPVESLDSSLDYNFAYLNGGNDHDAHINTLTLSDFSSGPVEIVFKLVNSSGTVRDDMDFTWLNLHVAQRATGSDEPLRWGHAEYIEMVSFSSNSITVNVSNPGNVPTEGINLVFDVWVKDSNNARFNCDPRIIIEP